MKLGEIKKIVLNDYYGKQYDIVGIICEVTDRSFKIFRTTGRYDAFRKSDIVKETSTRLPEETRTLLKNWYKLYLKKEEVIKKEYELDRQMRMIGEKELANSMGLLSKNEFMKEFIQSLPEHLRCEVENMFRVELYGNVFDIECNKNIEKYLREEAFVYEEYDGTIQFITDCEKDKNYQAYIKKYKQVLPIKMKPNIYLSLGDKNWLICCTNYRIELKKPLTKTYAEELAIKFSKS